MHLYVYTAIYKIWAHLCNFGKWEGVHDCKKSLLLLKMPLDCQQIVVQGVVRSWISTNERLK